MTVPDFRLLDVAGEAEEVRLVEDAASGLKAVIALHSTALGPATGGIRRAPYATEQEALADALRLAETMTLKCALAELPAGGGKTAVIDRPGLDVPAAYEALGRAVDALGGRYFCGPDVGTGERELDAVRRATRHVDAVGNDAGAATAAGVLAGLRGTLAALDGSPASDGRSFVVQGLGSVGRAVARALLAAGADVAVADVRREALAPFVAAGARVVAPERAALEPCDVLVPCALGGVLTRDVAERAAFRAVCGSANNQLASEDAGRLLHERGKLVAPDFVVSAGAVIQGVLTWDGRTAGALAEVDRRIAAIEGTTARVLEASAGSDETPHAVARRLARERLRGARAPPREPS